MFQIIFLITNVFASSVGDYNGYRHSPTGVFDNGYPENKYHEVLDTVLEVYTPIVENLGGSSFVIERDWFDGAVNMWAERWGEQYRLEIPGGMSRYHLITEEAFIISICHELGHLLGGVPSRGVISLEGQSDYFANQNCTKLLLSPIDPHKDLDANVEVSEACEEAGELCPRVLQGSLSLTSYYAELEAVGAPRISTPSAVTVSETLNSHPPAQCRLDTLVAGYFVLPRPSCWYKEK